MVPLYAAALWHRLLFFKLLCSRLSNISYLGKGCVLLGYDFAKPAEKLGPDPSCVSFLFSVALFSGWPVPQ